MTKNNIEPQADKAVSLAAGDTVVSVERRAMLRAV